VTVTIGSLLLPARLVVHLTDGESPWGARDSHRLRWPPGVPMEAVARIEVEPSEVA
jgi:hypothetical protein